MRTRITFVGGGSTQWMPPLVTDVANTPCLVDAELVLHDLDPERAQRIATYVGHVARRRGIALSARCEPDLHRALDGADFVVVCISTGGLATMAVDLELSARHGVPMAIGDSVGPAGIARALRNVPVLAGIARAMERHCPDAWMLNVSNPLTALTRAVTKTTGVRAVGLCHEVTNLQFFLSQLLDCGMFDVQCTVAGVNHLPVLTSVRVGGEERMAALRAYADGTAADLDAPLPVLDQVFTVPAIGVGAAVDEDPRFAQRWTKRKVVEYYAPNFELLRQFGALPGAAADHTVEFFPGFLTEASRWGARWGVTPVTIADREAREVRYTEELDRRLADDDVPSFRGLEMVAPVMEALLGAAPRATVLPLNVPNHGQCPDVANGCVVEAMCTVDAGGIRGRDVAALPVALADLVRRITTSQECTVGAALEGDRDQLLAALFTDPFTGRLDHDELVALRDDILTSHAGRLPQF